MKLKTLIKTLLVSHMRRAYRSISAAKSKTLQFISDPIISKKHKRGHNNKLQLKHKHNRNKIFFGSFRFHYNWCSSKRHSHVLPVPAPVFDGLPSNDGPHSYYDSTWHSTIPTSGHYYYHVEEYSTTNGNNNNNIGHHESQLYGYLQWLEEKRVQEKAYGGEAVKGERRVGEEANDDNIDKLADRFIANCHAKFILEKQESARRFKEMLERSA